MAPQAERTGTSFQAARRRRGCAEPLTSALWTRAPDPCAMHKRKAADAADEQPPAQAAAPSTQRRDPILVTAKRRERREQQIREKQRLLNANFTDFVLANKDKAQTLEDACNEYLRHCGQIYAASAARAAGPDLASRRSGALYVIGSGDNGQLGLGEDLVECAKPRPVLAFGDLLVKAVACGGMHTLALTEDGGVWSWGVNDEGALGRVVRGCCSRAQPLQR